MTTVRTKQKSRKSLRWPAGKTAQDIQDGIFKKMSADKKIELVSRLWQFGKKLAGIDRILYGTDRPAKIISQYR